MSQESSEKGITFAGLLLRLGALALVVAIATMGQSIEKFPLSSIEKQATSFIETYVIPIMMGIGFILLAWILLLMTIRFCFWLQKMKQIQTSRIILSRDDTTEPFEMTKFFDFVNGICLANFPIIGFFKGQDHIEWRFEVQRGKVKNIYISTPKHLLPSIESNLQSVYQNIRFERVNDSKPSTPPPQFVQLTLSKKWIYTLQTLKNYQKPISESIFSTLDHVDENCGVQVIMTPIPTYKQKRLLKQHEEFEKEHTRKDEPDQEDSGLGVIHKKQLQGAMESRGKGLFEVEIRIYAETKETKRALVGVFAEAKSENSLVMESMFRYFIRYLLRKYWWNTLVRRKMPSILLGPKMILSSFHLATLLQLPTIRIRVSGLERSNSRRVHVPSGIPNDPEEAFLVTEDGQYIAIPYDMRYQNTFFSGMHGSGKTTALVHYAAPVLKRKEDASIIVTHDKEDAKKFLQYIPPEKKVYIIDLSCPGEYGLNVLADDDVPADTLAGNLLSSFRTAYGESAVGDQSGDFLLQSFLALRKVRELHARWREAIPIIDFRHMRDMISDDQFRERVVADLPPGTTIHQYWTKQFSRLRKNPSGFISKISPILNKYNTLLQSERLEKILCHPNPITLRKAIREEKAVLILYTAKHEVGEENAKLFANMLMSLIFQAISSQAEVPEEERVPVHLFLDEVHGYANHALLALMQESRKYGARTAGATLSLSSIPPELQAPFNNLFGNKVIFRTNDMREAENWSKSFSQLYSNFIGLRDEEQDRIRIGADDIRDLKRFHCVCRLTVDGEVKDAFIAQTIKDDKRARRDWLEAHPWPVEKKDLVIPPVRVPELRIVVGTHLSDTEQNKEEKENTNMSFIPNDEVNTSNTNDSKGENNMTTPIETAMSEKEVYPSIGRVSSKRIEKIVKDLGIEYPQARKWLNEAIIEIERKKIKKGIVNFLETFLKEKLQKEQIKS